MDVAEQWVAIVGGICGIVALAIHVFRWWMARSPIAVRPAGEGWEGDVIAITNTSTADAHLVVIRWRYPWDTDQLLRDGQQVIRDRDYLEYGGYSPMPPGRVECFLVSLTVSHVRGDAVVEVVPSVGRPARVRVRHFRTACADVFREERSSKRARACLAWRIACRWVPGWKLASQVRTRHRVGKRVAWGMRRIDKKYGDDAFRDQEGLRPLFNEAAIEHVEGVVPPVASLALAVLEKRFKRWHLWS